MKTDQNPSGQDRQLLNVLRILIGVSSIAGLVVLYHFFQRVQDVGLFLVSLRWTVTLGMIALGVLALGISFVLTWTGQRKVLIQAVRKIESLIPRCRWLVLAWFVLGGLIYSLFILGPLGYLLETVLIRICFIWPFAVVGAVLMKLNWPEHSWLELITVAYLVFGAINRTIAFFPSISNYPFSLGWSEASRYYYASLYMAEKIYGVYVKPTVLHPTRYLLQSIPFLISSKQIWLHRLWQVFLWIAFNLATAILLARRLSIRDVLIRMAFIAWAYIFLFQGPVFYHLLGSIILVLWGYEANKFWKSLFIVLISSVWAGISRVNWMPVPGLLAASLYFLEHRLDNKSWFNYTITPVIWVTLGMLTAVGSLYTYAEWTGNALDQFSSSFTSDLLWYRLLPNPSNQRGVLPSILLVSLPIFGLLAIHLYQKGRSYHPIRLLGIGAILSVLFAGGLIVSVKIGGGSNLHNLDAYLLILLVVGSYVFFGRAIPDSEIDSKPAPKYLSGVFTILGVLIPLYFALRIGGPVSYWDPAEALKALETVRKYATQAAANGDDVLFIGERHLLTFEMVEGVPLVPDYERVYLMEMAMANNEPYMEEFHSQLAEQKFGLIISEPFHRKYKDQTDTFGEENNAWVKWVSESVMCYYKRDKTLRDFKIQFLVPRDEPGDCP